MRTKQRAARLRSYALALALLAPTPALAGGPAAAPGLDQRDLSLARAKEGLELYRAERWQDAYERFRQAEQLYHAPTVVIYLARCQRKLGKLAEARALYEQVLAEPLAKDAPPPFLEARRNAEREIEEVKAELAAAESAKRPAPLPSTPSAAPMQDPTEHKGSLLPGGIALGLGAVGVGIGSITGVVAISRANSIRLHCQGNHCPGAYADQGKATVLLGNISTAAFVIGGAAVAAGVVLLVVRPGGESKPAASGSVARALPGVSIRAGVGLGGLDVQVSF